MSSWVQAFQSQNTWVVLAGVVVLGLASGVVGSLMLLRKRSLMADATSHATLPGIAVAFLVQPLFGLPAKFLPGLLLGALLSGLLGMLCITVIQRSARINEDAAMGIVLSVFYGFGIFVLGMIQNMEHAAAAGLKGFIFGKTASMLISDAILIGVASVILLMIVLVFLKEFRLLCFDGDFARSQGWPVGWLDVLLMGTVVAITVIGLQAVGLILVIALLVVPPAAARFWTHRLRTTLWLAGFFGALSGAMGTLGSAVFPNAPAGAVIVLCQGCFFVFSLFFGIKRGLVFRWWAQLRFRREVEVQHILRSIFEILERQGTLDSDGRVRLEVLAKERPWGNPTLRRILIMMRIEGLVFRHPDGSWGLTREGLPEARRMVRNHRLWELFLIHYADIAPGQVDRQADRIEHVLGTRMVEELEALLPEHELKRLPPNPHAVQVRA